MNIKNLHGECFYFITTPPTQPFRTFSPISSMFFDNFLSTFFDFLPIFCYIIDAKRPSLDVRIIPHRRKAKERTMRTFWSLGLLALAACNNGGEDIDSGDIEATGSATVTVNVTRLGESLNTSVAFIGHDEYTTTSGTETIVAAPDAYTVVAGDSAYTAQFGFPIVTDDEGEYWAMTPAALEVEDGENATDTYALFNLFEPGDYTCKYDKYAYDASAENKKGKLQRTRDDFDPVHISVSNDGKVETEDEDENWDVVGRAEDYVQVEEDHLVLVLVGDKAPSYITTSQIGKRSFSLTVVNESYLNVADVTCDQ